MRNLHVKLPDEIAAELDMIVETTGADQTRIIRGMIEHWAAVVNDHKARGFLVRPLPGASFSAAMVADRIGMFDAAAPGRPTSDMAMGAPAGPASS